MPSKKRKASPPPEVEIPTDPKADVLIQELIKLFQKSSTQAHKKSERIVISPPRALIDIESEMFAPLTETSDTPDFSIGGSFPMNKMGEMNDPRGDPRSIDNLMSKVGTLEARVEVLTNVAKEDRGLLIQVYTALKSEGRL